MEALRTGQGADGALWGEGSTELKAPAGTPLAHRTLLILGDPEPWHLSKPTDPTPHIRGPRSPRLEPPTDLSPDFRPTPPGPASYHPARWAAAGILGDQEDTPVVAGGGAGAEGAGRSPETGHLAAAGQSSHGGHVPPRRPRPRGWPAPAGPGRGRPDLRGPGVPPCSLLGTAGVRKQRFPGDDRDSSHSPLASTPPLPLCLPGAGPPVPTEGRRLPAVTPSSPCAPVSAPPCDTPSHTQASVPLSQQPPAAGGSNAPLAQTGRSVGGTAGTRGLAAPRHPRVRGPL